MLWDALNFPDIRSWPAAVEANFRDISLAKGKGSLLYTPITSLSSGQGMVFNKREKGRAPSEIKGLRFALIHCNASLRSGQAFDFIHPFRRNTCPGFPPKTRTFHVGKLQ
jgi:hypothetical protein